MRKDSTTIISLGQLFLVLLKQRGLVDIVSDSVILILGDHTNCAVFWVRHVWILYSRMLLASQNISFKRLKKKRDFIGQAIETRKALSQDFSMKCKFVVKMTMGSKV